MERTNGCMMMHDSRPRGRTRGRELAIRPTLDAELEVALLHFKFGETGLRHEIDDRLDFLDVHRREKVGD